MDNSFATACENTAKLLMTTALNETFTVTNKTLYQPDGRGFENEIVKRLNYWKKLRNKKSSNQY